MRGCLHGRRKQWRIQARGPGGPSPPLSFRPKRDRATLISGPSQGSLYPHEKMEIHFRFSPRYTKSNKGWKTSDQPPPRKDYTLFMHIETVGSVAGISNNSSGGINNGGIACQLKDNNLHGGSFFSGTMHFNFFRILKIIKAQAHMSF